ncbi:hypothetical protein [Hymenobacter koreensis]|uniref:Uncharacterized protein n=1 Tax=Hymenobacter koreensis TaxID=1084523 RepID=A0ABP8IVF9_9BACT
MSKSEVRVYSESDADMRQRMRTMHGHFVTDAAAFGAFNPDLNAAFATAWLAALDAADQATPGTVRVGELKEETAEVNDVMEQARQQVQQLYYYVGQAFPKNPGRLEQYGKKLYEKARTSHEQMRALLDVAVKSAERDEAALAAKGYPATKRLALQALSSQLTSTNTTQEVKKGENKEASGGYLALQNAAYGFGQQVSSAAKVLFVADATRRSLYRLSDGDAAARAAKKSGTATV